MEKKERELRQHITTLLDSQQLAVLSTQRNGHPYSSLMAFAYTGDLRTILVATGKSTRKHGNILSESRVSLLIDNRSNCEEDFHRASAVTVLGTISEIPDVELPEYNACYLERHPYLQSFLTAPATVFLKVEVHHYLLVNRFQHVMELHLRNEMDIFA